MSGGIGFALALLGVAHGFSVVAGPPASRHVHRLAAAPSMGFVTHYVELGVKTGRTVSMVDITGDVRDAVVASGCVEGTVTVLAKHSTVGVMLNEFEERFVSDARQWLQKVCQKLSTCEPRARTHTCCTAEPRQVVPPDYPWLHNDIDFRAGPPGYEGGDEAWRAMRAQVCMHAHYSADASTPATPRQSSGNTTHRGVSPQSVQPTNSEPLNQPCSSHNVRGWFWLGA